MTTDILLVHPPAFYDEHILLPRFPGPIAQTVSDSTPQFMVYPVGLVSIAEYLERHGYRVRIDNLGERLVSDPKFDLMAYIDGLEASVFGIDLHWCVHIPGAMALAEDIKKFHPDSFILLGGFTSTLFAKEILKEYGSVDGVVCGEAEESTLALADALSNHRNLSSVPNLCYRDNDMVVVNPNAPPPSSLDDYDFTRVDLVSPSKAQVFSRSSIPVCRGCIYSCATCGGSSFSYRRLCGRNRPAFRSPQKIAEDLIKLKERGVRVAFMFQDPQMAGEEYCNQLVQAIRKPAEDMDAVAMEFFSLPSAEYLGKLTKLANRTTFTISPEASNQEARINHGKVYSDDALLELSRRCDELGLKLTMFFMSGVAHDASAVDKEALWTKALGPRGYTRIALGAMILLDPGSQAFDRPHDFGYVMRLKSLREHREALSLPSWHQWFNYTFKDTKSKPFEIILHDLESMVTFRHRNRLISTADFLFQKFQIGLYRYSANEVDKIYTLRDETERCDRLWSLAYACSPEQNWTTDDPYGYRHSVHLLMESIYRMEKAS